MIIFLLSIITLPYFEIKGQIANHIANGSFEDFYECTFPYDLRKVKSWLSADSSASFSGLFFSTCNNKVPQSGSRYQYPKTGSTFIGSTLYNLNNGRGYLKNRLRANLKPGKTYCVKFFVNIDNNSPRGIDGFGIYFGDESLDTITKCEIPLTYLNPQVENSIGNIISDTLNWVEIGGTFVANGYEKFALVGNFFADNATSTTSINTPFYPQNWTDVMIDDVSCIDIDLPAFAGLDTFFIPGTNLYLGRERDVGIDEACTWYQMPNMTTAIDTAAGIWITPVGTSTYVVRQEICGNIKWDTVVVRESPVGLEDLKFNSQRLTLWPQPAKEEVQLQLDNYTGNAELFVFNNLGMMVRRDEIVFKEHKAVVRVGELEEGVYFIELKTRQGYSARNKLIIER